MKKLLLGLGLCLGFFTMSFAQAPTPVQGFADHPRAYTHRYSQWFEANLNGTISKDKRWQYQMDVQYRRMSDASFIEGGQHGNIFKDPYQQVYRPWIHFWIKPGAIRFSLSPIGYWATWTPPAEGALYPTSDPNSRKSFFPEIRTCPQITLNQTIGRFQFVNRYRYEFRWIGQRHASSNGIQDFGYGYDFAPNGSYGSNHQGRFRWQVRMQVLLNKPKMEKNTIYINSWNELFLGIGRHVGFQKMLNQNRSVAMIGWRLPTEVPIKIEAGVTYQMNFLYNMNQPPTDPSVTYQKQNAELNTAYTVYLIFDEFHELFKSKKKDKEEAIQQQEVK
ncbi:MAG: DUF2490 domain-containing protein [Cytophagaceae bacterium]